ncbi:MAG: hypothetical protein RL885_15435 [Planctomycetota bacterium]
MQVPAGPAPIIGARMFLLLTCLLAAAAGEDQAPVSTIVVLTRDGLQIVTGDQRRALEGTKDVSTFCWDRDARHLIVTAGGAIARLDVTSGERRILAELEGQVRFPDVDSGTGRIAFASHTGDEPGEGWTLEVMSANGEQRGSLGPGYDPCFDRTGELWFEAFDPRPDLWIVDVVSGQRRRAFGEPAGRYTVSLSGDGRWVAFSTRGNLSLHDRKTGKTRSLESKTYDRFASFSPDRRHVTFIRQDEDGEQLAIERDLKTGEEACIASESPVLVAYAPHRRLEDFLWYSWRARQDGTLKELTGIDGRADGPLALWVQRSLDDATRTEAELLCLRGVETLSVEEARELSSFQGGRIFLPDLKALDEDTARALTEGPRNQELYLDGLKTLTEEVARYLVSAQALSLNGVKSLDPTVAKTLATIDGSLSLDGLTSQSLETAKELAEWDAIGERVVLSLDGLGHDDIEAIQELVQLPGWGLALNGIQELPPELGAVLARFDGALLSLNGLSKLPRSQIESLLTWKVKFLEIQGLEVPEDLMKRFGQDAPVLSVRRW